MPLDGVLPFLISWGSTTHPSLAVPEAGRLLQLEIHHPDTNRVKRCLGGIAAIVDIHERPRPGLRAVIQTANGEVVLE